MTHYLKKHWKINLLVVLLQIAWAATMVFPNVAMMKLTQGIVERKLDVFIFWIAVDLGIYSLGCVFLKIHASPSHRLSPKPSLCC